MLSGWAYSALYASSRERTAALDGWLWRYNHHRRHSALGRQTPITRLNNLLGSYNGTIPGAYFVPRNVLEWRLDPACAHRDAELARGDAALILICDEGYQSSLAAATVRRFGERPVTDVVGGFRAWRAAGLPVRSK